MQITPNKRNLDSCMHSAISYCADHTEGSREKLTAQEIHSKCIYDTGAVIMAGPTLSPVALLCFTWLPSQRGNLELFQHLHRTHFSPLLILIWWTIFSAERSISVLIRVFEFALSLSGSDFSLIIERPWKTWSRWLDNRLERTRPFNCKDTIPWLKESSNIHNASDRRIITPAF
jgi:hypothetical protein